MTPSVAPQETTFERAELSHSVHALTDGGWVMLKWDLPWSEAEAEAAQVNDFIDCPVQVRSSDGTILLELAGVMA